MTTRKTPPRIVAVEVTRPSPTRGSRYLDCYTLATLASLVLGGAGCATPGPLHVYSLPAARADAVRDEGNGRSAEWPSFLTPGDEVTGFAYDPYTDHFFLRLAPGDRIRVVDRPAKAIKREFDLPSRVHGGDLAVRPLSGHMFLLNAADATVLEVTRLGKFVRTISLVGTSGTPVGIAYDAGQNQLLVLGADRRQITAHDMNGRRLRSIVLTKTAGPSLAFDSAARHFYAPLDDPEGGIGVFDETGRWLRTDAVSARQVDVGPRSLVRVF